MLLKVFSNDHLLAIVFSLAKGTVSTVEGSMDSQPFLQPLGFAKRAGLCYPAGFDFNLLFTVGRLDRKAVQGRLPCFIGNLLFKIVGACRGPATSPSPFASVTDRMLP